jgi:uncharacterized protein (TIGR03435 family)
MNKLMLWIIALAAWPGGALLAQSIAGTWQGALQIPQAPNGQLRIVIKVSTTDADTLKAVMYSIDQGGQPMNANSFTLQGSTVKMAVAGINGNYEGKLSADGTSIAGTWTQGPMPLALNLKRATNETAWTIPDPLPPPKMMPEDAKPEFEVATIKPSKTEERFSLLVNRSGMLNTTDTSVSDLIKFAYDVHPKQISGGPAWLASDKFDVTGKPDTAGIPSINQLKVMVQKLLAERFQLKFHREQKELSVYAITIAKGGPKITKEESNPKGLPGFGGPPQRGFNVRNSSIAEFASVMQANFLEQPVVDQTGLGAVKYDFVLKWTPDASQRQMSGAGPEPTAPAVPDPDAPPDLFTAIQQQLGLKLQSAKAPVDVIVIDRVDKPSEN